MQTVTKPAKSLREPRSEPFVRIRRYLYTVVGVFVVLTIAVLVAANVVVRGSLPRLTGTVVLPVVSGDVLVERDALGVPTIRAETRADAAAALGFVHAQDRFFQMDLARRAAAGEISALFGAVALDFDRNRRRHRLRAQAENMMVSLADDERLLIGAYVDGVNTGFADLDVRPFEYLLLGVEPDPWRAEDTLLVAFAMWFRLTDSDGAREARLGVMHDVLPQAYFDWLTQQGTEWDAAIDGSVTEVLPVPGPDVYDLRKLPIEWFGQPETDVDKIPAEIFRGSNNWAVSGSRTAHGGALLANDMHLGLAVPNTWYRARIVAGDIDATGVTLPGLPFMIAGSNGYIAWGFTNTYGDWVDRVVLETNTDGTRYRTADGERAFDSYAEEIEVKGQPSVLHELRWTIWGPVVGPDHNGRLHSIRWLAHEPEATNLGLIRLETVTDVDEAIAIANTGGIPPQNFVVADRNGNIGWTVIGRIPLRSGFDPVLPSTWIDAHDGWNGWVEPEDYPRVVNPASGTLWSANNRVVGGDALATIGDGGFGLGARARQIRDGLAEREQLSVDDMLAIQLDDRALLLQRWQELLLDLLSEDAVAADPKRAELKRLIEQPMPRASTDSVAYRLVRSFRLLLREDAIDALTAEVRSADSDFQYLGMRQWEGILWQLVEQQPPHLLSPRYANWDEQLLAVVDRLIRHYEPSGPLADRSWGERNSVTIRHPLSNAVPVLSGRLDMPTVQMAGDANMPRVQDALHGSSERLGVSPGREREGYFHMPGGQSGHPLSPYYRAGHDDWVNGTALPFLPGPPEHVLTLSNGSE